MLSLKHFTQDHLMRIKLLVVDITAITSPVGAEIELFGCFFIYFLPMWATLLSGGLFVYLRPPLLEL